MLRPISEYRTHIMGIAILWVVLFHTCGIYILPDIITIFQNSGYLGVDIFFFVSAYGLYHSMHNKDVVLQQWYLRRILRIIPAFLIVTTLLFAMTDLSIRSYFYEIFFLGFFMPWSYENVIYWYIPAILIFYFFFPYLYRYRIAIGKYYILIAILSVMLSYTIVRINSTTGWTSFFSMFTYRIPAFLIGLIYAEREETILRRINESKFANMLIFLSGITFIFLLHESSPDCGLSLKTLLYVFIILSLPFIFTTCDFITRRVKIIRSFLQFTGRYSLEIYLLHIAFLRIVCQPFVQEKINSNISMGGALFLSIPAGCLLSILIEPINRKIAKTLYARINHNTSL